MVSPMSTRSGTKTYFSFFSCGVMSAVTEDKKSLCLFTRTAPLLSSGPPFSDAKSNNGSERDVLSSLPLEPPSSSDKAVDVSVSSLNETKQKYTTYAAVSPTPCHNCKVPKHMMIMKKTIDVANIPEDCPNASLLTITGVGDDAITAPNTTVEMNSPLPSVEPITKFKSGNVPSVNDAICAYKSGAPFPNANNVAPAASGDNFIAVAVVSKAGTKNTDAHTARTYAASTIAHRNNNVGTIVQYPEQYAADKYACNLPSHASVSTTCVHFASRPPSTLLGAHALRAFDAFACSNKSFNVPARVSAGAPE
mmetsp:Transcript_5277/g.19210  ORF Transcript_5277/g.19210 Transcript_5277/m.19210 type:complete len:308 (+) Transcript_5277:793-1716(+)